MTTRRDFLQYLGISGLVAAVHNVNALGITVLEKKLILPNDKGPKGTFTLKCWQDGECIYKKTYTNLIINGGKNRHIFVPITFIN